MRVEGQIVTFERIEIFLKQRKKFKDIFCNIAFFKIFIKEPPSQHEHSPTGIKLILSTSSLEIQFLNLTYYIKNT